MQLVDLVGVGLNATDTVIAVPRFPEPGSKIEYRHPRVMPGGQTATAVIACQRWGLRTRYVGKLGDDAAATLHRDAFRQAGVEAQLLAAPGAVSAQSLILVDPSGERTVLCRRDDATRLEPGELHRDWVQAARVLLVDGFDTAAATLAASWARQAGLPVVADLDEVYPGVEALLAQVTHLIVSRDFPARLTGEPDLPTALREMQARYGCALTAATLGEEGVLAWDSCDFYRQAAFPVPVVDTTGAGDLFHAGFILGLLEAWPLPRQLEFACAAAALNCMHAGARGGIADRDEIEALMAAASLLALS